MSQGYSEAELDSIIQDAIRQHGSGREAVIPLLSEINRALGYIPVEAFGKIRRRINTPQEGLFLADSHLFATASFYQMFSLKPLGKHVIRFCRSAPCHVAGGRQIFILLQEILGIAFGETTPDEKWSLVETSCLGLCSVGPAIWIDEDIFGFVTADRLPDILARYS